MTARRRRRLLRTSIVVTSLAVGVPLAVAACASENDDEVPEANLSSPNRSEVVRAPSGFEDLWRLCLDGEGFLVESDGDITRFSVWDESATWCPRLKTSVEEPHGSHPEEEGSLEDEPGVERRGPLLRTR